MLFTIWYLSFLTRIYFASGEKNINSISVKDLSTRWSIKSSVKAQSSNFGILSMSRERDDVVNSFNIEFGRNIGAFHEWSGDLSTCTVGGLSSGFKNSVLQRLNWYRNMAGLPSFDFKPELDYNCQAAAFVQSFNVGLDNPVNSIDKSYICYSDEAMLGTQTSTIFAGNAGLLAISLMIDNEGVDETIVPIRMAILNPDVDRIGMGVMPIISGLNVKSMTAFDLTSDVSSKDVNQLRDGFVAWPPPGFFPYPALPEKSNRWSFYPYDDNYDFTSATVSVVGRAGISLNVQIVNNDITEKFGPLLVFEVEIPKPTTNAGDTPYVVTISNIRSRSNANIPASITYTVTILNIKTPVIFPSGAPSLSPVGPSRSPSRFPTKLPTKTPNLAPGETNSPTISPTVLPTRFPSQKPVQSPISAPTLSPTPPVATPVATPVKAPSSTFSPAWRPPVPTIPPPTTPSPTKVPVKAPSLTFSPAWNPPPVNPPTFPPIQLNPSSRDEIINSFNLEFGRNIGAAHEWSGDIFTCTVGSITTKYKLSILQRFNWYRRMIGLPVVVLRPELDYNCQAAALVQSISSGYGNTIAKSAVCYSDEALLGSQISSVYPGNAGLLAISNMIDDFATNHTDLPWRMAFLNPDLDGIGIGVVPLVSRQNKKSMTVIDTTSVVSNKEGLQFRDGYLAWPPPGYFPYLQLPLRSDRWSFYPYDDNYDFTMATVEVEGPVGVLDVTIVNNKITEKYGSLLVFEVEIPKPAKNDFTDAPYTVTINDIRSYTETSVPSSITYTVTVLNLKVPAFPSGAPSVSPTGPTKSPIFRPTKLPTNSPNRSPGSPTPAPIELTTIIKLSQVYNYTPHIFRIYYYELNILFVTYPHSIYDIKFF